MSPPQPIRGLGERRELPQKGPGHSPGRKFLFDMFWGHRRLLIDRKVRFLPFSSAHRQLIFFCEFSASGQRGGALALRGGGRAPGHASYGPVSVGDRRTCLQSTVIICLLATL